MLCPVAFFFCGALRRMIRQGNVIPMRHPSRVGCSAPSCYASKTFLAHMKMKTLIRFFGLLLFLLSFGVASDPLTVGAVLPELTLPDQHEEQHTIVDPQIVVFAPDKEAGELAHQILGRSNTETLKSKGIVYVSDISAMPSFVTSLFALPKMRDYPYGVLLGYESADTALFPRQEGQVTVLNIASKQITRITFAASAQTLGELIGISAQ